MRTLSRLSAVTGAGLLVFSGLTGVAQGVDAGVQQDIVVQSCLPAPPAEWFQGYRNSGLVGPRCDIREHSNLNICVTMNNTDAGFLSARTKTYSIHVYIETRCAGAPLTLRRPGDWANAPFGSTFKSFRKA